MIMEFEFFHGVVFSRLFHRLGAPVTIEGYTSSDNASYVLNGRLGIYVKYSKKRMSPWGFSFLKRHQDELLKLKNEFGEVILLLVCNDDGIVALNFDEVRQMLDEVHQEAEWIRVKRSKRQMYELKGSDGALDFKIGRDDMVTKIRDALARPVQKQVRILTWLKAGSLTVNSK